MMGFLTPAVLMVALAAQQEQVVLMEAALLEVMAFQAPSVLIVVLPQPVQGGISGPDEVCLARHRHDENNHTSYLTLVATISDDSSEDEGLKQAITASMESRM